MIKNFQKFKISLFVLLSANTACMQRKFNSGIREAFNKFDSPESLGLSPSALDWENIKNEVKGERSQAWSDTWWPHASKGIADRYILRTGKMNSENLKGRNALVIDFAEQYFKAISRNNPVEMALLSPAEKYDYLTSKKTIPEDYFTKNSNYYRKYSGSNAEKILLDLEDKLEILGKQEDSYKAVNKEYVRQANESANSFTPLLKEGSAINAELKNYLPITAHDWELWLSTFSWAHDDEWAWMGICNGWSPAALREEKPRHSVMAIKGNKRVLLTEGDIRGLLSWVWGWQFPNQTLGAGLRCDANQSKSIVKGKRIIDGRLCEGKGSRVGHCVTANTIFMSADAPASPSLGQTIRFGLDPVNRNTHEATLKTSLNNAYFNADVKDLSTGETRNLLMQLTQNCRDMNPGLFHAALVDLVARRKTGFVVDADRYTQVWNQPVYAYEMTYLPILKRDGKVARAGEPVAVKDIKDDPYAAFRSDKTSHVVQLRTKVIFAAENGPLARYSDDTKKETPEELLLDYTLELSNAGKIVGGEWGLLPGTPGVRPLRISNSATPTAPDFIWNYPEKSRPEGEYIDYSVLKKIHDCSVKSPATATLNLSPYVKDPLPYAECILPD